MALDSNALVALIISLVALVIALAQLLAQVFGTVEGHRKCQASVMGKWSKNTHRHWRWTQFRFETRFTTPDIILASYPLKDSDIIAITGGNESRTKTFVAKEDNTTTDPNGELACWVPLLISLHEISAAQLNERAFRPQSSWPAVRKRQRSWDFMPPDIARPFAVTSASDIAILTCRMGVVWKEFRPPEGIMEGQSREHIFSAINVRGLGTLLGYTRALHGNKPVSRGDGTQSLYKKWASKRRKSSCSDAENGKREDAEDGIRDNEENEIREDRNLNSALLPIHIRRWICTPEADSMWFGILPGNQELSLPTFTVGTNEDAFATLQQLDSDGVAVQHLRQVQSRHPGYLHGFCDIVPMVAPWLCQPDSRVNCYPQPLGPQNTLGLTWYCSAYKVFYDQLLEYNERKGTIQTQKIAKNYEYLRNEHKDEWDGISPSLMDRSVHYYNDLESLYKDTTEYFQGTQPETNYAHNQTWEPEHYMDLVAAHLREAPRSYPDALSAIADGHGHNIPTDGDKYWRGEAMMYYWCYMPDYVRVMTQRKNVDADLVEEAWITLIFRALLWMRAHIPCENSHPLPSQYYGSRLPVYIG